MAFAAAAVSSRSSCVASTVCLTKSERGEEVPESRGGGDGRSEGEGGRVEGGE
jgi:hypothetical protein